MLSNITQLTYFFNSMVYKYSPVSCHFALANSLMHTSSCYQKNPWNYQFIRQYSPHFSALPSPYIYACWDAYKCYHLLDLESDSQFININVNSSMVHSRNKRFLLLTRNIRRNDFTRKKRKKDCIVHIYMVFRATVTFLDVSLHNFHSPRLSLPTFDL